MKKYLLLPLLCISFATYPSSLTNILWTLFGPVQSIDGEVEARLNIWNDETESDWIWIDNWPHNTEELRSRFPNNPTTVDRMSKRVILAKHNRLMKVATIAIDSQGRDQIFSSDYDYEATWNEQPLRDRLYWTLRYRRPYTYVASIGKWALEIAIVAGCVKLTQKLKKWH